MRHDGVDLLVDPGTYCYHGEPEWRSYFRSTRAHNTLELDGEDQAHEAGPFMWAEHADAVVDGVELGPAGRQVWSAHHTAYARLDAALCHDRDVVLDGSMPRLTVTDTLTGSREHRQRMSWHLGPEVRAVLSDGVAELTWRGRNGEPQHGQLTLPIALDWSAHHGESDPPLGWYSPQFGTRVATTTLVGQGSFTGTLTLRTVLDLPAAPTPPAPDMESVGAALTASRSRSPSASRWATRDEGAQT